MPVVYLDMTNIDLDESVHSMRSGPWPSRIVLEPRDRAGRCLVGAPSADLDEQVLVHVDALDGRPP